MAASVVATQPPSMVFQTIFDQAKGPSAARAVVRQNSSTPLEVAITLGEAARAAAAATGTSRFLDAVGVVLRRFDWQELQVALPSSSTPSGFAMAVVRLPQRAHWAATLSQDGATLKVHVQRRHLPVSTTFGSAPYVLLVTVPTGRGEDGAGPCEVLYTTPFLVASKPRRPDLGARAADAAAGPARYRTPVLWVTGPAVGAEATVNVWAAGAQPGPESGSPPAAVLPPRFWVRGHRSRVGAAAAGSRPKPPLEARATAMKRGRKRPSSPRATSPGLTLTIDSKPRRATLWEDAQVVDALLGAPAPCVPLLQQDLEALGPGGGGGPVPDPVPAVCIPRTLCVGTQLSALVRAVDLGMPLTEDPEDWQFQDFFTRSRF